MMEYDYIITKPPLDENTLAHYGVKGMKWRRYKKRNTQTRSRIEIPGAKQGQALGEGIINLGKKIRKATGLDAFKTSSIGQGNTHYVKDPLGSDWLYDPHTANYKLRKWASGIKKKKKGGSK